jgi:dihydroorotase
MRYDPRLISEVNEFTIPRPDNWHCHFRLGLMAEVTLVTLARYYGRILGMPNIKGRPIAKEDDFLWYKALVDYFCEELKLECQRYYMLMLQDGTSRRELEVLLRHNQEILAMKGYLHGTTTNSDDGVGNLWSARLDEIFRMMADKGIPLSIHLEEPGEGEELAEEKALWRLEKLHARHPRLRIIMEHVSTAIGINLIKQMPGHIAGTLTIQHALLTRKDALGNPHLRCKPIAKTAYDREAIIQAALSGDTKFFEADDTAGHVRQLKEQEDESKRPSGIWNAPTSFPLWTGLFEQRGASVDQLAFFSAEAGELYYGLRRNEKKTLRMVRKPWLVPESYGNNLVVPLGAGERLPWQAAE